MKENIPAGIYYSASRQDFYDAETKLNMGVGFFNKWYRRSSEFPVTVDAALAHALNDPKKLQNDDKPVEEAAAAPAQPAFAAHDNRAAYQDFMKKLLHELGYYASTMSKDGRHLDDPNLIVELRAVIDRIEYAQGIGYPKRPALV